MKKKIHVGEDVKKLDPSYINSGNVKCCSLYVKHTVKQFGGSSITYIVLPCDSVISFLDMDPPKLKSNVQTKLVLVFNSNTSQWPKGGNSTNVHQHVIG